MSQVSVLNERSAGRLDRSAAIWDVVLDTVLDILRAMRLTGGLFLDAQFGAPWCISAKITPEDCVAYLPEPRHIIAYHYVTAGRCSIKVAGQAPVEICAGDIVVLPRNDDHVLGTALNLRPVSADKLIRPGRDGALARIVHGGDGERTQILCGFLGNDRPHNAFIAMLPSLLRLNAADGASGDWIESTFRFAAAEIGRGKVSSPGMLARLAELLFMEAVRRYLATLPPSANPWTAGLSDPLIARALGLLHGQIARRWTTEELARELAVSRSAFADRFTRIIGEPPMRYLARQRFEQASAQLRQSSDPIARIAFDIGYESEAAFNRAFKRQYGVPPAEWRREQAGSRPRTRAPSG